MHSEEPFGARSGMNRRHFLRMSGIGVAGAVLLGATGYGSVLAQEPSAGPSLTEEFEQAASRYQIPVELLMALGYVNTRWEMPPPEASEYEPGDIHGWGGYGIMHLVRNPSSDTLGEASRLSGIPEERLKTDRKSNILGGAALLAASQGTERPARSGRWLGAVAGAGGGPGGRAIRATSGVGGGKLYAEQVLGVLKSGASRTIRSGERISLPPQEVSSEDAAAAGLRMGRS
jgi:hypothetical protein